MKPYKPLGHKSYGSIPHLIGSRLGEGDHHCHEGQVRICTERVRDRHDRIIVTEKLDGSNVAIARIDDDILALGRAGYLAQTSRYEQHQLFAAWVRKNRLRFEAALSPGERLCGEWLAQAHGTRYDLKHEPFVAFDIIHGKVRLSWDEVLECCDRYEIVTPFVLNDGPAITVEAVSEIIRDSKHGALDPVEGAVWRVERHNKFDFMAKWVRTDKVDGCYLPEISGKAAVWNWHAVAASREAV